MSFYAFLLLSDSISLLEHVNPPLPPPNPRKSECAMAFEIGVSFFGFKPVDEHIDKKLSNHLSMIIDNASRTITRGRQIVKKIILQLSFYM